MEAVAHGKAHNLFDAGWAEAFAGVRRPQEDLVTSALFGSVTLLPFPDRRRAFDLILGFDCLEAAEFPDGVDVAVRFWPGFRGTGMRRRVEPDILLECDGRVVIVEVKWHAPLSDGQLDAEIDAVLVGSKDCLRALLLLGGVEAEEGQIERDIPVFSRTWRRLSAELLFCSKEKGDGPLGRWCRMVQTFLQRTDLGHVFGGMNAGHLGDPGTIAYRLQRPGTPPWFEHAIHDVGDITFLNEVD